VMKKEPIRTAFREGDQVFLSEGTYQGTLGTFVRLTEDPNWADISERNGRVRSRPVAWLDRTTATNPGFIH
jgi:hypothetical protein